MSKDDLDFTVSGFIYNTSFSDTEWQEGRSAAAVNMDLSTNNWRINSQVGTDWADGDHLIRRLFLEYAHPGRSIDIDNQAVHYVMLGRFTRLDSFYNNATDTPATSGMAMLPLATYNYRFQDGTFTSLDGLQYRLTTKLSNNDLVNIKASYGRGYLDDEKRLNTYLNANTYLPGIDLSTPLGSCDFAVHYDSEDWYILYAHTRYLLNSTYTPSATNIEKMVATIYSKTSYDTDRIGVKYQTKDYYIQSEFLQGETLSFSTKGSNVYKMVARDWYVLAGINLTDDWTVYSGYSSGSSLENIKQPILRYNYKYAKDAWVGATLDSGPYTISLEYHNGSGTPWTKIGSKANSWQAGVLSATYRF